MRLELSLQSRSTRKAGKVSNPSAAGKYFNGMLPNWISISKYCFVNAIAATLIVGVVLPAGGQAGEPTDYALDLLWKTGVDEPPYFRSIDKILQQSDGEFIVLDSRSLAIHRYTPDGTYVGPIELAGEGPGEATMITDLALDERDRPYILSPFGPAVIAVQAKWEMVEGPSRVNLAQVTGNVSLGMGIDIFSDLILILRRDYDSESVVFQTFTKPWLEERTVIAEYPTEVTYSAMGTQGAEKDSYFANYRPWHVSRDGELFIAHSWSDDRSFYQIDRYSLDGRLLQVLSGKRVRKKRTEQEIRLVENECLGGGEAASLYKQTREFLVEEYPPDIRFICEVGQEIWVETTRPSAGATDVFRKYDVFSKSGIGIGQARLLCKVCTPEKDRIYLFGDTAIVVKGMYDKMLSSPMHEVKDADPLQILCFRLRMVSS